MRSLILALALAAPMLAQDGPAITLPVSAHMDIYRAGGYNDGSNGIAPVVYSFAARARRTVTFSAVAGSWTCSPTIPPFGADGEPGTGTCGATTIANPVGPFSGYSTTDFGGGMVGMFLEDTLPTSPPPPLRFYNADYSHGGIQTNFPFLTPAIGEVFFIGDGLTGTGTGAIQVFRVPPTATHMYLGFVDSCAQPVPGCYSDNSGTLTAIFHIHDYELDWVEQQISAAPSARCCPAIAYDPATQSTVLFGGGNGGITPHVVNGDTWIWRNGWTQLAPATSPPAREAAGTAYDPRTGTVVMFGGTDANANPLGDTWTWDGTTWTEQFPPVSPPARGLATQSMTYDAATGTVLLFGGLGASSALNDTWEWNGLAKTWTQKFPATSPSPRRSPLAYDAAHKQLVLFGGDNGGGDCCSTYYNETWTWDGVTWTQQSPNASPSGRTENMLAYDANAAAVVMFGGYFVPSQGLTDTWAWGGKTWTELNPPAQPGGTWGAGMVFDPLSRGLLLFGGENTGDPFTNKTWLYTFVPVQ